MKGCEELIFKERSEPEELKLLRYLQRRMSLPDSLKSHYINLEKGFIGELQFDERMKNVTSNLLFLNDLLFECNNTLFQIDTLLLTPSMIYFFEVKNFDGNYYIEDEKWYTYSNKEIQNPLFQLHRSETLLRRMLQDIGLNSPLEPNLCFINPEFHLYQAPRSQQIIFLPQLPRFIKKLNTLSGKINAGHFKLAEKLVDLHITKSPYEKKPEYSWHDLRKGITCYNCHSFIEQNSGEEIFCRKCGTREKAALAILRNVDEFVLLFPERKISTMAMYDWCGGIRSKRVIRRVLQKKFSMISGGRHSYFIDDGCSNTN